MVHIGGLHLTLVASAQRQKKGERVSVTHGMYISVLPIRAFLVLDTAEIDAAQLPNQRHSQGPFGHNMQFRITLNSCVLDIQTHDALTRERRRKLFYNSEVRNAHE